MTMTTPRAPAREIFGWAMFDFANSSYTTVICRVAFNAIVPPIGCGLSDADTRSGNGSEPREAQG
jgi:UMF1 family MFS transporter